MLEYLAPLLPLVRMLLSAQATSAASEAAFSAAGFAQSDYRSELSREHINSLSVIKCNAAACDPEKLIADFRSRCLDEEADIVMSDDLQEIVDRSF